MMASACLAAHLPPSAFGDFDVVERALIGVEMLELLREESRKAEFERMKRKLDG